MTTPAHKFSALHEGDFTPLVARDSLVSGKRRSQSGAKIPSIAEISLLPYKATASSMVNKFPVKGPCQECDTEELLTVCENCGGAGEFVDQHITGYDPRDGSPLGWEDQYSCPVCGGTGCVVTEAEPITLDDFEECFG